jgi:hypothetical protein
MKRAVKHRIMIPTLRLHKETIRALTEQDLALAAGGAPLFLTESCMGGCK